MEINNSYKNFLKEKGRALSEINPGSQEYALNESDAFLALELLKKMKMAVLGADILTEDENGELCYFMHKWGYEYCYLNWDCDKNSNESEADYALRSVEIAKSGIHIASETAQKLRSKYYIVLVVSFSFQ
jgi:hypothetical protein